MQLAVKQRDASRDIDKRLSPKRPSRYTVLSEHESEGGGRAEILLALPSDADTLDQLVVIKAFRPELPGATPAELTEELSLAARLDHENIARTLSIGFEWGRYFVVREYLEGTTLRSLLGWSRLSGQAIPNAAVVRILLGIVHALEHGARAADSAQARALINQPVAADDVFITYAGAVKLLGFKAGRSSSPELRVVPDVTAPDESPSESGAQTAIDALLSSQLTPELARVFARMASSTGSVGGDRFQQVLEALDDWQLEELAGDGRAELAAVMAQVWPEARAKHIAQLQASVCELRARRGKTSLQSDREPDVAPVDVAPVSEQRARGSARSRAPSGVEAPPFAPAAGSEAERSLTDRKGEPVAARVKTSKRSRRRAVAASLACASLVGLGALYLQRGSDGMTSPPQPRPAQVQTPLVSLEQGSAEAPPVAELPAVSPVGPSPGTESPASNPELSQSVPAPGRGEPGEVGGTVASARERSKPELHPGNLARHVADVVPARPGYLTLDTTPWSNVALGGASLGQTPLVGVALPPGEHLLELVNPELGIASGYIVTITSGVTTARRVGLEQPRAR